MWRLCCPYLFFVFLSLSASGGYFLNTITYILLGIVSTAPYDTPGQPFGVIDFTPDCARRIHETGYQNYGASKNSKASDDIRGQTFNVTVFTPDCALRFFALHLTCNPNLRLPTNITNPGCTTPHGGLFMLLPLTVYVLRLFTLNLTPKLWCA